MAAEHLGSRQVMEWRDAFEDHMLANVPGTAVNGDRSRRLPNTTNISFEGIEGEGALILFDQDGLCCSAGSACTSGSVNPSHVLKAMGLSNERARASLRFSFGRFNSASDIQRACQIVREVVKKLRTLSPAGSPVREAG
jgi:cysteine desulfurase